MHVDDVWDSRNQICRDVAFEFYCSPEVVCGKWPRCFKDLFPYFVRAICQKYATLLVLRIAYITVYLIYRGEKAVEVVRKFARVKFVDDFT